jgi:hypothetical protein
MKRTTRGPQKPKPGLIKPIRPTKPPKKKKKGPKRKGY